MGADKNRTVSNHACVTASHRAFAGPIRMKPWQILWLDRLLGSAA